MTLKCGLLAMAVMAFAVLGEAQDRQEQDLQFSDLRRLNWAQGFDSHDGLEWGMSPDEVQPLVGLRLELEGPYADYEDVYSARLSTTWHRQRVDFDNAAFSFVRHRLYFVNFDSHDGWEDGLLHSLFASFGPARHAEGRIYHKGEGELVGAPVARRIPRTVDPDEDPEDHEYQWMDAETEVMAYDAYGYNNVTRRKERFVGVIIKGWRVAANAAENYSPDSRTFSRELLSNAQEFLDWLNWWRTRR